MSSTIISWVEGGGYADYKAIEGYAANIVTNPTNGNILSFDITATYYQ